MFQTFNMYYVIFDLNVNNLNIETIVILFNSPFFSLAQNFSRTLDFYDPFFCENKNSNTVVKF